VNVEMVARKPGDKHAVEGHAGGAFHLQGPGGTLQDHPRMTVVPAVAKEALKLGRWRKRAVELPVVSVDEHAQRVHDGRAATQGTLDRGDQDR
jgi:hypothetical protein